MPRRGGLISYQVGTDGVIIQGKGGGREVINVGIIGINTVSKARVISSSISIEEIGRIINRIVQDP